MSAANIATKRRAVRYNSLEELLADAEELAAGKHRTIGNWSYGQILDHLARAMTCPIDGYGFKAPWMARKIVAPLLRNSILTKGMRPGIKLPASASILQPPTSISVDDGLANFRQALKRVEREPARESHPFLGNLASQEWTSLHLRHSELHMSYVLPVPDRGP